jgi:hypothetical protein
VEGDNKYLLTITEAFPKDAGTYTAVAKNAAGEATTTCCLAVKVLLFSQIKLISGSV